MGLNLIQARSEPNTETDSISGIKRCGLDTIRTHDCYVQDVGLEPYEGLIHGHATINAQHRNVHAEFCNHGIENLASLVSNSLQHNADDMVAVDKASQTDDDATGVWLPAGGEEIGEGRHDTYVAVIPDALCLVLDRSGIWDCLQLTTKLLDKCPTCGDRALKSVDKLPILDLVTDSGDETMPGSLRALAGVHKYE